MLNKRNTDIKQIEATMSANELLVKVSKEKLEKETKLKNEVESDLQKAKSAKRLAEEDLQKMENEMNKKLELQNEKIAKIGQFELIIQEN